MHFATSRTLLTLLVCVVMSMCVDAQDKSKKTLSGTLTLTSAGLFATPSGDVDLGLVDVSQSIRVEIDIVNGTQTELVCDKILGQVGQVTPKRGTIAPGKTLRVAFEHQTPATPNSERETWMISLLSQGQLIAMGRCHYAYSKFIGISDNLITVMLDKEPKTDVIQFTAPIVLSDELQDDDFDVDVTGIEGEFSYSLDRNAMLLNCEMKLDDVTSFDRVQGNLEVLDLASGRLRETPLVIQRITPIEISPPVLEFTRQDEDQDYHAMVFVRPLIATTDKVPHCNIEATIGGEPISCKVSRKGSGVFEGLITLSEERVEKLRAGMIEATRGDSPSDFETVQVNVMYDANHRRTDIPFSVRGIAALERKPQDRLCIIDAIRTGMTVIESLSPFEFYGTSTETQEFELEPPALSQELRFRLSYDHSQRRLVYASETKPDSLKVLLDDSPAAKESVRYSRVVIEGTSLWEGNSGSNPGQCESFEHALAQSSIPLPFSWGLTQFPTYEAPDKSIRWLAAAAGKKNSTVTMLRTDGGLRFILRENESPIRYDIRQWSFQLPGFLPTSAKVERSISGTLVPYFVQHIKWDRVSDQQVPVLISAEYTALRRTDNADQMFQLGTGFRDTKITWLSVGKPDSAPWPKDLPNDPDGIKAFIDEGARLAESRAK